MNMKMYKILLAGLLFFGSIFNVIAQPDVRAWDDEMRLSIPDLDSPKAAVASSGCDWIPPYLDDIGAFETFRDHMAGLGNAIYTKTIKSYKALKNTVLRSNIDWLETLNIWQDNGVLLESTSWGTLIKNANGVEIGRIVDGNKVIVQAWDVPLYNPSSIVINQLPKTNYELISNSDNINGELELVSFNGDIVFRRKYSAGCGSLVNFENENIQGILNLSHFDPEPEPDLGFSGVYHLSSNKFILHPSARHIATQQYPKEYIYYKGGLMGIDYDGTFTTYFTVNRNGGHLTGSNRLNEIIGTSGHDNKAGFAIKYIDENTLKINFVSNGLNKKFHPDGTPHEIAIILPQDLQDQILPIIQNRFPNKVIIIE